MQLLKVRVSIQMRCLKQPVIKRSSRVPFLEVAGITRRLLPTLSSRLPKGIFLHPGEDMKNGSTLLIPLSP